MFSLFSTSRQNIKTKQLAFYNVIKIQGAPRIAVHKWKKQ